jgi:ArsR family transcriptional regulator
LRRKGGRHGKASGGGDNGDAAGPPDWSRVARTLKAVAHPLRLRIIDLLEGGERSVGDIVEALGAKPAVTSQQLGLMRDRGVLEARREGNHVYYRIANRHVVNVIHCVRRSCRADESES